MGAVTDKTAKVKDAATKETATTAVALRLPLSDTPITLKTINALLSSAQTREKVLKIIQYSSKLLAYTLLRTFQDASVWGKHWEALAKNLSTARRFFKLFRWIKHLEDIKDARNDENPMFRNLLLVDVACNVVADISEDITSFEKLGFLRKGTLPKRTEYYANWCQLVLAGVEIMVSAVKARRMHAVAGPDAPVAVRRKRAMADLEFSKFIADLVKAFWDCELSFASELGFCIAGLWAACCSSHKYALKVIK